TMPPTDNPRPDAKTYESLVADLVGNLDRGPFISASTVPLAARLSISSLVSFFDEWLGLNRLAGIAYDALAFPDFDAAIRHDMLRETELFIESQIRDNRPVIELWTANYTYLNDRLAKHYGISNVSGPEFRRVSLDPIRAGLLGQASVLALTSVLLKH